MSQTATNRAHGEVRLKVAYKKPEALLSEYTRSIGRGGVTLQTQKSLPVGTRFVFEMHNPGVSTPVEVVGEVVRVTPQPTGRFMITVKYDPGQDRGGLDAVLQRIFDLQEFEKLRRYPRIPLHLPAMEEETPFAPPFFVRDLSRGGVGLEVEAPALPTSVKVGMPFLLEMDLTLGTLMLHGEVAWTSVRWARGAAHLRRHLRHPAPGHGGAAGEAALARVHAAAALARPRLLRHGRGDAHAVRATPRTADSRWPSPPP